MHGEARFRLTGVDQPVRQLVLGEGHLQRIVERLCQVQQTLEEVVQREIIVAVPQPPEPHQTLPLLLLLPGRVGTLDRLLVIVPCCVKVAQVFIGRSPGMVERGRVDCGEMASRLKRVGEMLYRRSR